MFISVFHTTRAVPSAKLKNETRHITQAVSANANAMNSTSPTHQAPHMNVTCRRGSPTRPITTAPKNDPAPPAASTVPNVAASPPSSLRMMYGSRTSNGPNVNSRNSAAPTSVPHSHAWARTWAKPSARSRHIEPARRAAAADARYR